MIISIFRINAIGWGRKMEKNLDLNLTLRFILHLNERKVSKRRQAYVTRPWGSRGDLREFHQVAV
jgi:hypothetical protein